MSYLVKKKKKTEANLQWDSLVWTPTLTPSEWTLPSSLMTRGESCQDCLCFSQLHALQGLGSLHAEKQAGQVCLFWLQPVGRKEWWPVLSHKQADACRLIPPKSLFTDPNYVLIENPPISTPASQDQDHAVSSSWLSLCPYINSIMTKTCLLVQVDLSYSSESMYFISI